MPKCEPAENYIIRETWIGSLANIVISSAIFFLIFGITGDIEIWGMGNYVFDYLPSLVGMLLVCGLIPSLITRNRLRKGSVSYLTSSSSGLPKNAFLRSALLALVIGVACWALVYIGFSFLALEKMAVWKAYLIKLIFIASLGFFATYIGIYTTLCDDRTS